MKSLKNFVILSGIAIGLSSCASNATDHLTVASKQVNCTGVSQQKCLLVKEGSDPVWEYLYQGIDGFNYEEGNEYVLEVKKEKVENPPMDAPSSHYVVVREVSKVKKTSLGLPK